MIELELAKRFIEQISKYTEYNINIMNEHGIIIASRDLSRVGTYHEAAYQILESSADIKEVGADDEYPGVRPGINMVINVDGKREGVVGITGNPDEVRSVGLIIRMSIETMLRYEYQQEEKRKRRSDKEYFVQLLTQIEHAEPKELRELSNRLNYSENIFRIPLLIRSKHTPSSALLTLVKQLPAHTEEDLSAILDDKHVVVFKTLKYGQSTEHAKETVEQYMTQFYKDAQRKGVCAEVFSGSIQNSFTQYYYGVKHARWLENFIREPTQFNWFYDYSREYFIRLIPANELQRGLGGFLGSFSSDEKKNFVALVRALMENGYNLTESARKLYIHKNTLLYRFRKMKQRFGLDPLNSIRERNLCEILLMYLDNQR